MTLLISTLLVAAGTVAALKLLETWLDRELGTGVAMAISALIGFLWLVGAGCGSLAPYLMPKTWPGSVLTNSLRYVCRQASWPTAEALDERAGLTEQRLNVLHQP